MASVMIVLVALVPVLVIGTAMVELMVRAAPRRGKRPDVEGYHPERKIGVQVIAPDGQRLYGAPGEVVAALARAGFAGAPRWATNADALRLLDTWSAVGRIRIEPKWYE